MLEEVIEETSKECLTDNREEEKDSKTKQSSIRQHILSESEDESSTHESNLNIPNERGMNVSEIFKKSCKSIKEDSSEQLEIYFSCHDRMVNGSYLEDDKFQKKGKEYKSVLDYSSIRDSREIASMPELCRSTLMDQIDYDLDNFKLNESSMFTNSIDQSKPSIPDQQFLRAKKQTENCEDIQPKFMNFLNDNQRILKPVNSLNKLCNKNLSNCGTANSTSKLEINKVKITNYIPKTICLIEPQSKLRNSESTSNLKINTSDYKFRDFGGSQKPQSVQGLRILGNSEIIVKKQSQNPQQFDNVIQCRSVKLKLQ